MLFRKGDKLRVKQDITDEMADRSCMPRSVAGMECTYMRGPDAYDGREVVDIRGSPWHMYKECLEYIAVPCMFEERAVCDSM